MAKRALVAGATGLVGGLLLDDLLQDDGYGEVRALVRQPLGRSHAKLVEIVADFDRLDESAARFDVDDVFCCLGTTIKTAGSAAAFRKVDHDYVTSLARLSRAAGAQRFFLVSSVGADPGVSNLYLSVKGEAEASVAACGFPTLHVFRPGLLLGPRQEYRLGERAASVVLPLVTPLLAGSLRRYRPIHVRTVAAAMLAAALRDEAELAAPPAAARRLVGRRQERAFLLQQVEQAAQGRGGLRMH
ncbi:MAG: NAD(P)H-binding protein [Rhodospirillales bacterium]|nr:NAD(P)H-binding protein [Rhodospirillales bacterium]